MRSARMLDKLIGRIERATHVDVLDVLQFTTRAHRERLDKVADERQAITAVLKKRGVTDPIERYNIEYCTAALLSEMTGRQCEFDGTHYWYHSPILMPGLWALLMRRLPDRPMIIDVGAGNGTLLTTLAAMGYDRRNMLGIDTADQSIERLHERGFRAYCGRIQDCFDLKNADCVFLSYFIDRDRDQRATLETAAAVLRRSGTLVLEGLFPCLLEDSSGVSYGTANVTRGKDAVDDMALVVAECTSIRLVLQRVLVGERLVYSLDGPEVLPTYILTFGKQ